jgi:hypothetical protein
MIRVYNREGSIDSPYLRIINDGHPLPILNSVIIDSTSYSSLKVRMPLVSDNESIISYEL